MVKFYYLKSQICFSVLTAQISTVPPFFQLSYLIPLDETSQNAAPRDVHLFLVIVHLSTPCSLVLYKVRFILSDKNTGHSLKRSHNPGRGNTLNNSLIESRY